MIDSEFAFHLDNPKERYAMEFVPWEEWLSMPVCGKSVRRYNRERFAAWASSPQRWRELTSLLDDVPPERQAAFVMRHQAGMSMGAIAEHLGCDHCTVVHHVMEAEKALLAKMGLSRHTPLPHLDGKPFLKATLETV